MKAAYILYLVLVIIVISNNAAYAALNPKESDQSLPVKKDKNLDQITMYGYFTLDRKMLRDTELLKVYNKIVVSHNKLKKNHEEKVRQINASFEKLINSEMAKPKNSDNPEGLRSAMEKLKSARIEELQTKLRIDTKLLLFPLCREFGYNFIDKFEFNITDQSSPNDSPSIGIYCSIPKIKNVMKSESTKKSFCSKGSPSSEVPASSIMADLDEITNFLFSHLPPASHLMNGGPIAETIVFSSPFSNIALKEVKEIVNKKPDCKPEKTLMVFDIDGTLISENKDRNLRGVPKTIIRDSVNVTNGLTKEGYTVLASTARSEEFEAHTINQLRDFGFEFVTERQEHLSVKKIKDDPISLKNNVISTSFQDKADALEDILKRSEKLSQYTCLFFVDNDEKNVISFIDRLRDKKWLPNLTNISIILVP